MLLFFFNKNKFHGIKYKCSVVTAALKDMNIHISATGLRNLIIKYKNTGLVGNKKRTSHSQRLISNRDLLSLNMNIFIRMLNIQAVTRYCQLVSPNNRIKRSIYACCAKIFNENYHDSIHADECTLEFRRTTIKTWFKLWYYYILIYFKK